MKNKRLITAILIAALMFISAAFTAYAEAEEVTVEMQELNVVINREYESFRVEWNEPEAVEGQMHYKVSIKDPEDPNGVPVSKQTYYPFANGLEMLLYYCQEHGVPSRLQFIVEMTVNGEKVAEGSSEVIDPKEFRPEKDSLEFGTDIPKESVRSVSWTSSGMSAESNWSYHASRYGGQPRLYFSGAGKRDREKKLSEKDWNDLWNIISKGHMERARVQDPEMEMLDGGGEELEVRWDMDDADISRFYSFKADESVRRELQDWFTKKAAGALTGLRLFALIPVLFVIASAAYFIIKKGRLI